MQSSESARVVCLRTQDLFTDFCSGWLCYRGRITGTQQYLSCVQLLSPVALINLLSTSVTVIGDKSSIGIASPIGIA